MTTREQLGRIVRQTWVAWAREQPDPKPSWLVGWDELDDGQREVDMRIGEALAAAERKRISQQAPPCQSGAPPNVLCMVCFQPLCRSCGACRCPDNSESLCAPSFARLIREQP